MVAVIKMSQWSSQLEKELTLLIKDWLKQKKKTQKDLKGILNANSERMPVLIEMLRLEYSAGGLAQLLKVLCAAEEYWEQGNQIKQSEEFFSDPFGQLDLLLEELKEDCNA